MLLFMPLAHANPALGLVTFEQDAPPNERQLAELRELGLSVQGLRELPIALVRGTPQQLATIGSRPGRRWFPDRPVAYYSQAAHAAVGVDMLQHLGWTGAGVTVAVIDSGIDATHVDLADHVTHNIKVTTPPVSSPAGPILIALDQGPYSNTDWGWGHGTLVAGALAGDGHTAPENIGVVPDATLVGYSMGEFPTWTSGVTAFDDILCHSTAGSCGDDWGIDVVSISWGTGTGVPFDPDDPFNLATRRLSEARIAVVVAAGNSGANDGQMSLNKVGIPPWTISVAGTDSDGRRWPSSSNGLLADNSRAIPMVDGQVSFDGDSLGILHPTIAAPAVGITVTTAGTGAFHSPGYGPDGIAAGSGTSFSAPIVAGVVALLKQANPDITVAQARQILEATATPTAEDAPFWQVGHGQVDAYAAMELVQSKQFEQELARKHADAERRARAGRAWTAEATTIWSLPQGLATVSGVPETHELTFEVPPRLDALRVLARYAYDANYVVYSVSLTDPNGNPVAHARGVNGLASAFVDLRDTGYVPGPWTIRVEGTRNAANLASPAEQGHTINVVASVLLAQKTQSGPVSELPLLFIPDPARATGIASPEGCAVEPGPAVGTLGPEQGDTACHTASQGWLGSVELFAEFASAPLEQSLVLGGEAQLVLYMDDPLWSPTLPPKIEYMIDAIGPGGVTLPILVGEFGYVSGRNEFQVSLPPVAIEPGTQIRVRLRTWVILSSSARMLFGGAEYGDAGVRLGYNPKLPDKPMGPPDDVGARDPEATPAAGGLGLQLLGSLLLGAMFLRRRPTEARKPNRH